MSDQTRDDEMQRLLELLSDRALFGLDPEELKELEKLQALFPDIDNDEMDRVVALLETGTPDGTSAMPKAVKDEILRVADSPEDRATSVVKSASADRKSSSAGLSRRDVLVSLLSMAATGLIATMAFWKPKIATPAVMPIGLQRTKLMKDASDLVQIKWTSTAAPIAGDVVWSNSRQEGYMTFSGLPINNPTVEQYQLWIFDETQSPDYPVDGGVFDVTGANATVRISAKLKIKKPTMFAITIEKPGGVVVSDRSRLPVIAEL